MDPTLVGAERDCVRGLAKLFGEGHTSWSSQWTWDRIGLTEANFVPVLGMMERIGAIRNVSHTSQQRFSFFVIDATAVQLGRTLDEADKKGSERKDIVELVRLTLRKHPIAAWAFIAFMGLSTLITVGNQLVSLLKAFGIL